MKLSIPDTIEPAVRRTGASTNKYDLAKIKLLFNIKFVKAASHRRSGKALTNFLFHN
ncbi:hypothetical protein H171_3689 [[Clostridium] celerecrescens 18A]|uniref:Uncharacterized protein n=1 Tax=[Clostridium] celerecrescens 18A TaxID=1286362 RepID=A0A2M8Z9I7_9FIRM|nr:hypothetical protein H171_3689 [[Clostridium] celerecrescens 18A]